MSVRADEEERVRARGEYHVVLSCILMCPNGCLVG